jgi:ArsR family transcriptional regulator
VPHQTLHRFKAEFFRALGHPARLRILELLRSGERSVSELQADLEIDSSSVSQQLAVLRAKNIVDTRRAGTSVYYSVRDPQVFQLLDVARDIFNNHLIDLQAMLESQARDDGTEMPGDNGARPSTAVIAR